MIVFYHRSDQRVTYLLITNTISYSEWIIPAMIAVIEIGKAIFGA